ncbi:hypothetical protein OV079_47455 [Nannocystis pusilla]|uniref:WD40 repeat domain-containing protein n=1 Tax=Nannocystis pusilla TaxID=889268 RepID=A0A9X3J1S9_9BACT|nr:hypothetical protein [Nannocystis pusilla]
MPPQPAQAVPAPKQPAVLVPERAESAGTKEPAKARAESAGAKEPGRAPVEEPVEGQSHVPEDMSPIVAQARRWDELGRPSRELLRDGALVRRGRAWLRGGGSLGGAGALVRVYLDASARARRYQWQRVGFAAGWLGAAVLGGAGTAHVFAEGLRFDRQAQAEPGIRRCQTNVQSEADQMVGQADAVADDAAALLIAALAVQVAEDGGCLATARAERELRRRLAGQSSRILSRSHASAVAAASVQAQGRLAVTVGSEGEVWVWDLEGGGGPRELEVRAKAVAWSEDEQWLVTGGASGEIEIFDAKVWPPESRTTLSQHRDRISALAIDPGSQLLASGDERGVLRLWSLRGAATGEPLGEPRQVAAPIETLAFDGNGRRLVALAGGRVQVWSTAAGRLSDPQALATEGVTALAISRKGDRLLTGDKVGQLFLWRPQQLSRGQRVREPFQSPIAAVAFVPETDGALAATADRELVYFDLGAPQRQQELYQSVRFEALAEPPRQLVVAGQRAITVGEAGIAEVWDLLHKQRKPLLRLDAQRAVTVMAAAGQQSTLVTGGLDGTVRVWDLFGDGGRGAHVRSDHRSRIRDVVVDPAGRILASAGADQTVRVYTIDGEATAAVAPLAKFSVRSPIQSLAISSDGHWLAGVGEGEVVVWDLGSRAGGAAMSVRHDLVRFAGWSDEGRALITAGSDGRVKEWRHDAGKGVMLAGAEWTVGGELEALAVSAAHVAVSAKVGEKQRVLYTWPLGEGGAAEPGVLESKGSSLTGQLVFDAQGGRLAIGYGDGRVYTWKLEQGAFVATAPYTSSGGVVALSFSTRGKLAIGNAFGEVIVMHPEERESARVRATHSRPVSGIGFGADPEVVVSAALDPRVVLWRGERDMDLLGHTGPVTRLLTDTQGRFAVTASDDGTVRVWPLRAEGLVQLVCATNGRGLRAEEWTQHLPTAERRRLCPTLEGA